MDPRREDAMKNIKNRWSVRHVVAAALASTLLLGAGAGCKSLGLPENRLMNCQTNDDCKAADPKKGLCANLRCVQCAYDSDCEAGICDNSECKVLFKAPDDSGPEGPPANLDACLTRCKDQPCTDKCHAEFKAPEPEKDAKGAPRRRSRRRWAS